jgi:hypothetical protein
MNACLLYCNIPIVQFVEVSFLGVIFAGIIDAISAAIFGVFFFLFNSVDMWHENYSRAQRLKELLQSSEAQSLCGVKIRRILKILKIWTQIRSADSVIHTASLVLAMI